MAPILETAPNIKRPGFWGLDQFLGSSAKSANSLFWLRFASYPASIRGGLCDYPGKMGNNWADSAPSWGRKNAHLPPIHPPQRYHASRKQAPRFFIARSKVVPVGMQTQPPVIRVAAVVWGRLFHRIHRSLKRRNARFVSRHGAGASHL